MQGERQGKSEEEREEERDKGTIILCTPPTAIPVHESWPRLEGSSESELWGQSEDNVET